MIKEKEERDVLHATKYVEEVQVTYHELDEVGQHRHQAVHHRLAGRGSWGHIRPKDRDSCKKKTQKKNPHTQIPILNQLIKDYAEKEGFYYLDYFSSMTDGKNG